MRYLLIILFCASLFIPATAMARTECATTVCTTAEVGPFMAGISKACGEAGTCQLGDIMTVVSNVGNWILGIIGSLVFLMYIWGGIEILVSGAKPDLLKQGKHRIVTATIGLLIVFFAYAGIYTLNQLLRGGGGGGNGPVGGGTFVACKGSETEGQDCAAGQVCDASGSCVEKCNYVHPIIGSGPGGLWTCAHVGTPTVRDSYNECQPGLCIDPDPSVQCCNAKPVQSSP